MMILTGIEVLPEQSMNRWILGVLLVAIAGLTTWIFPYHYYASAKVPLGLLHYPLVDSVPPALIASTVLAARNALYLGTVVWMMIAIVQRQRQIDATRSQLGIESPNSAAVVR